MLENKTILVVDDDLTLAEMYELRFREEGANVEVAHDGEEALKMIEDNKPSIVLLDIMMPKFSGLEVLQAVRENPEIKNTPIIVFTVLLENDKYEKARQLGADGYLIKSESMPTDVVAKVKEVLSRKQESS